MYRDRQKKREMKQRIKKARKTKGRINLRQKTKREKEK
jgi:hypothetical protein